MASLSEQQICIECGFCCDGTLFSNAKLEPGEKGSLPEKIEAVWFNKEEMEFFRLPCLYFMGRCSIYESKKASICSAYRCELLKDVEKGNISQIKAIEIIHNAIPIRKEIFHLYQILTGNMSLIYFRKLLRDLGKILDCSGRRKSGAQELNLLIAKCNIFEALLIKHFRSEKDFESMIADE